MCNRKILTKFILNETPIFDLMQNTRIYDGFEFAEIYKDYLTPEFYEIFKIYVFKVQKYFDDLIFEF